jgi:hypothetical protein
MEYPGKFNTSFTGKKWGMFNSCALAYYLPLVYLCAILIIPAKGGPDE